MSRPPLGSWLVCYTRAVVKSSRRNQSESWNNSIALDFALLLEMCLIKTQPTFSLALRCLSKGMNAIVEIQTQRPVSLELYKDYKELGRFMLRYVGYTIAAGVVTEVKWIFTYRLCLVVYQRRITSTGDSHTRHRLISFPLSSLQIKEWRADHCMQPETKCNSSKRCHSWTRSLAFVHPFFHPAQ